MLKDNYVRAQCLQNACSKNTLVINYGTATASVNIALLLIYGLKFKTFLTDSLSCEFGTYSVQRGILVLEGTQRASDSVKNN